MGWKIVDQDGEIRAQLQGAAFKRMTADRQREIAQQQARDLTRFSGGKWRCRAQED